MKTFFFFWRALALVSLVLGLEPSYSWPRECLSSERLSLALASDFFVSLALASSLVSSTPPLVNQYKSKSRDVICGIPQGSTLGPLLFTICINDLPLASNSTIHLFADDTNLTLSHSNVSTLQQNINDELVNVSNWLKVNKLSINFNKTEFMVVTTKQNKPEFKYQ